MSDGVNVFGLWIGDNSDAADQRSMSGEQPDLLLRVAGHVSATDLIAIGEQRWPGRHIVREVNLKWRAVGAPKECV